MSFLQTSKLVHHPQGIWDAFRYCLLFYHLSSQCESFYIEVSNYGEDQFTVQPKTVVKQPVIFKQRSYL